MKKVYVAVAAAMIIASGASAQTRFGIEGGVNLNNLADHYEGETTSNQIKVGFHAGVLADIGISDHFSVAPALRYSMKGGQEERNYNIVGAAVEEKNKLSYHYLELPVNIVYKTGMQGEGRFMIGAGPYIAYMVNAQNKYKRTIETENNPENEVGNGSQSLSIGNDPDDYVQGLDYGAQAFVGYQFPKNLFLKVGSQVGFADTRRSSIASPSGNPGTATAGDFGQKNYNFFFTLGYMFGK